MRAVSYTHLAPFIAEPYFGHRSRLYDLDLHRNPDAIADIIIESYNHGVRAINLVNDDALIKGFDMALDAVSYTHLLWLILLKNLLHHKLFILTSK